MAVSEDDSEREEKEATERESRRMGNVLQQDLGAGESLIDYDDSAVKQGLAVVCLL